MRKLYNHRSAVIDDCDKGGTCGEYCLLWILRSPACYEIRHIVRAKFDCEDLCQLFNTKGSNGSDHAPKKSVGMLEFFFRNSLQHPFLRVVQSDRQLVQSLPNTRWHASTKGVQLAKHPPEPVRYDEQQR